MTTNIFNSHLSRFDPSTGLLGMSYAEFPENSLSPGILSLLKLARGLGLVTMETGVGDKKDLVRVNNLTIINFVLKWVGPTHEERLTTYMMAIQVRDYLIDDTLPKSRSNLFERAISSHNTRLESVVLITQGLDTQCLSVC